MFFSRIRLHVIYEKVTFKDEFSYFLLMSLRVMTLPSINLIFTI